MGGGEKGRSIAEPWLFELDDRWGDGAERAQCYTKENQTNTNNVDALFVLAKVMGVRASWM